MLEKHVSCTNPAICKEFISPSDECKKKKCKFAIVTEYEVAELPKRSYIEEIF